MFAQWCFEANISTLTCGCLKYGNPNYHVPHHMSYVSMLIFAN